MAIIFTYPTKATPALADTVVITDSESEDPENRTKQTSIASIKALIDDGGGGTVGGSGTVNKIAMWSGTDTLTDSNISDENGAITINAGLSFTLSTDSSTKIAAGPNNVTLYSDTSATATTTSTARLATDTTGVLIYGQTIAAGATSERGGIIRYYNNANSRYVGISGPITTGTSYQIRLPDTVGEVGQVLAIASIEGSNALMEWADNGSVVPSNPVAVDSMVTFNETVAGNGAAKITVSGGTPNYNVQVEETTTEQSFSINGSNNQTVFNFGTQAGGTSGSNLAAGTWQVLGGDSSTPQKLFKPLNKTFVIQAAPSCDVTTVSTTTDTSAPGADDGAVSIAISDGLPDYAVTITHSDTTTTKSTNSNNTPVSFTLLKPGTWTISGTDGNGCDIPGSGGVATFIILDRGTCNVTTSVVTTDADEGVANGSAVVTILDGTANYNMTIQHTGGTSQTKDNNVSNVLTFTGLLAGTWSITGSDGDACPISSSFVIGSEARSCSLTLTPTVTNASASGVDDGTVSIKVDNGIANYNAVIEHTDGTQKSSTFTESPIIFTGLKAGTWTLTGTDNEPSGTTKCSLAGYDGSSFIVGTNQTCNLTVEVEDIVQSDGASDNGTATLIFSGATGQVSGTISSPDQTDINFTTTTVESSPTAFLTGLGVGVWEIAGTDSASPACALPSGNTFIIGNSGDPFLRLQFAGSGYTTGEGTVYNIIYKPGSPAGDGSGMKITVASSVGTGPAFSPNAEGEGYEQGDILNATNGPGDPSGNPQVLAQYKYIA
tara:strand:+ start:33 stop:2363 length:2331 start_codon:yes stop_codon:yes gene_type:complete